MSLYDIDIDYKGRKVIMHSDPDRIIFINSNGLVWEDGTSFTADEIVDFMRYYRKTHSTPSPLNVGFMDGQEEYCSGYGLSIEFDGNGEPLCRIEDGKVLSGREMCECEKIGYKYIRVASDEEFKTFQKEIVNNGTFTLLKETYKLTRVTYRQFKCNKCGEIWLLDTDRSSLYAGNLIRMTRKKHLEQYLKSRGEDKGTKTKRIIILILLLILMIAGFIAFAAWLTNM